MLTTTRAERKAYYRNLSISAAEQDAQDRKSAHARYERAHYRTVCCRVPVERATRFAYVCYAHGITPYSALKHYVDAVLRADEVAQCSAPKRG